MAVRSKHLAGPTVATVGGATIYTAPSGETTIVKTITIVNNTAVAGLIAIGINGLALGQQIVRKAVAAQDSIVLNDLFIVLQPGDTIQIAANANNTVSVGLFGAELEGVAD